MQVPPLVFLAPVFLLFEVAQLIVAERYLGVKQIEAGIDPRESGPDESTARWWSLGILGEALWLTILACYSFSRVPAACLLLVTLVGFTLRNNCRFRWVLVLLTLEGSLRIGFMIYLMGSAWRSL